MAGVLRRRVSAQASVNASFDQDGDELTDTCRLAAGELGFDRGLDERWVNRAVSNLQ